MPLPTKDAITFRGTPSCGDKATIALSLKLTQKQVEAVFARQESINKHASTQFPLEIDFDNCKLYIGDTITSFNPGKESAIRDICRRTPSSAKPLAGLFLSAAVVGKLLIPRELDDAASNLRKATEAERTKKNERGVIRMNAPIASSNGKKSGPSGVVSGKNQATTRVVSSSQTSSTTPRLNINSIHTHSSKLPSSHSSSSFSTTIPTSSRGGIYSSAKNKETSVKLGIPKRIEASTMKRRLEDNSHSKPRKVPRTTEETKAQAKVKSSWMPTSSTVSHTSKSSISTSGKSSAPSRRQPSPRPPVPESAGGSIQKRKLANLEFAPTSDMEEGELTSDLEDGEIPSRESKKRRIIGPPKAEINISKECKLMSGPATLPDDKESLCREYGRCFAHYVHTMSKFYAQKSKVEAALALDDAGESTVEEDLMDSKALTELCEEFHRTRTELERILKAHRDLNANA